MTSKLKRIIAEELLSTEFSFLVTMNVEHPGVGVPAHVKLGALRLSPQVAVVSLVVGYKLSIPIQDLVVDDEGITATLSFNRTPYWCSMPWDAILGFAGAGGKPIVAFNPETSTEARALPEWATTGGSKPKLKSKIPKLRLVWSASDEKTSA
jgi:hypothetical protein